MAHSDAPCPEQLSLLLTPNEYQLIGGKPRGFEAYELAMLNEQLSEVLQDKLMVALTLSYSATLLDYNLVIDMFSQELKIAERTRTCLYN